MMRKRGLRNGRCTIPQSPRLSHRGDTRLISAAVPLVPLLGDVVRDAWGDHPGNLTI
jgi:hypothetical protein